MRQFRLLTEILSYFFNFGTIGWRTQTKHISGTRLTSSYKLMLMSLQPIIFNLTMFSFKQSHIQSHTSSIYSDKLSSLSSDEEEMDENVKMIQKS